VYTVNKDLMLNFLKIRRDKVACRLNFDGAASAENPIANFALAHYEWQKEYIKVFGTVPPDDDHTINHSKYYNRIKYGKSKSDLKDKKADIKKRVPKSGRAHYNAARLQGQDDMLEIDELGDSLALDIADQLGGDLM
jgi:hypothetical protein